MSDWPQKFLHAFKERHHYDNISGAEDGLSLDDAYDIQHRYVALRDEPISGYKAALTASAAQAAMGITTPIIGALFASGDHPPDQPVPASQPVLLETELAFRLASIPSGPVTAEQVFELVDAVVPVIELASPNLASKPGALDLVATNSASHGYICGAPHGLENADVDGVQVALFQGDEPKWQGQGSDVLGGQRQALAFLINEVLARNYQLATGHLLLTGSIGGILPAAPGHYRGEFGALGEIRFEVSA